MKVIPERQILRKMNFLSDQEGIMSRYLKESENWAPHLNKSRDFIIKCVYNKKISKISILGSGWLLDVPLEELNKLSQKILLIDICHPPQILRKIRDMPRVEAIEMDITGGMIEQIFQLVKKYRKNRIKPDISMLESKGFNPQFNPGFVVSLNILNQLDILLIDYLKKYSIYKEEEILSLRKHIQQSHLDSITSNNSCLITDFEELVYDQQQLEKRNPLIHIPLPEGKRKSTWEWGFDSQKTYNVGKTTRFNVIAIEY
jgi:hypothetical protein